MARAVEQAVLRVLAAAFKDVGRALHGPAAMAIRLVVSGRRLPGPAEPRILEGAVD
ncbi:MAG TPA: hypothetical protein VG268_04665 [Streptosporangiaceae bacterium]|nr:hypothetical protein [Streptosporangiaceae bacterium]